MSIGIGELLLILVIVFVLFGAGKLPQVMNDIGKGIKGLKKGLKDEEKGLKDEEKIACFLKTLRGTHKNHYPLKCLMKTISEAKLSVVFIHIFISF